MALPEAEETTVADPLRYRLFMFTGTGPGAGKSTLSAFLARQFALHRIPARWLYEEDVLSLDGIRTYNEQWIASDPRAPGTFIDVARNVFADPPSDETWVVDSWLPGFNWLLGRYPLERVRQFEHELAAILLPLEPLAVFLDAEIDIAFARATAGRGKRWAEGFVPYRASWKLPYYPEQTSPEPLLTLACTIRGR